MIRVNHQQGFSAVELLITLFVASLFIIMAYQLYGVAIQSNGEANELVRANNIGYEKIRNLQLYGPGAPTCPPSTPTTTESVDSNKATMTTTISCPSSTITNLRLIVVTVKYNASQQEASHAIYVTQN